MRFTREIIYNSLAYESFQAFIESIKKKYPNEHIIGYQTKGIVDGQSKVVVTFSNIKPRKEG